MAGKPKQGIDYAGWSVNIFDGDIKIDKLLDSQGWLGFAIYFYLCQMAYKFDGYFYRWGYEDAASTARRMGGGVSSGTVKETVAFCLKIGLFDKRTFDEWGVLTSKGIQRRYCAVLEARRAKSAIKEYWLLKGDECKGLVMNSLNGDDDLADGNPQEANGDLSAANDTKSKVKESRANESKVNQIKAKSADEVGRSRPSVNGLEEVKRRYEEVFNAVPSEEMTERLKKRIESLSANIVCHAMDKAEFDGNQPWSYAESILDYYSDRGLRTLDAVRRDEEEFNEIYSKNGALLLDWQKNRDSGNWLPRAGMRRTMAMIRGDYR